jgi:hypothetical protein
MGQLVHRYAEDWVGVSPDDPLSYCKAGMIAWAAVGLYKLNQV